MILCHLPWWPLLTAVALDLQRCDFPRVDGRNLTFEELVLPVLVHGLGVPELPPLPLEAPVQVSNGRNEEGQRRYLNTNLSRYLSEASTMRLEDEDDLSGRSSLPTIFLSDLLTKLQRQLWQGLQVPKLMEGFAARPILSIGVKNSGEDFHNHEETWLWLAQGIKAWWIADAQQLPSLRRIDPCTLLSAKTKSSKRPKLPQLQFCVQHPGDAIFFGDHAHGTCNLDDLVVGLGAQGRQGRQGQGLVRAAESGQLGRVEEAIRQQQADASVGRSAMHAAAIWGHQEAATLLLKSGARIRADGEGLEPIHLAALHGHASLVELLSSSFEGDRFELMHRAAMQGHVEVMKSLLKGAKHLPSSSTRAIHFAAKGGHIEAVDFLLRKGASLEEVSKGEGLTPLHFAASQGHAELVRHLVRRDAQLVAKDSRGLDPIHLAVHADSARVVREMMAWSFPEDLPHFAAEGGRLRSLRSILKQKPQAAQTLDRRGFCPLHMAAMAGHSDAIQLLVEHGASLSQPEAAGFTSLHFAAKGGHRAAVERLLQLRADVGWRSKDGTLPRDVASRMHHKHLLELLTGTKGSKGSKGGKKAKGEL
eukprot:s1533_g20.t1